MTPSRREFLRTAGAAGVVGATGMGLGGLPAAGSPARGREPLAAPETGRTAPKRILILGGTGFIGPHMVRYAVERGHEVSIFTRGRTEAELPEVRAARRRVRGWSLDGLITWVAARMDVSEDAVRAGRRSRSESRARAVIAGLASVELAIDLTSVATATGVSLAGASRAARRGEAIVRSERLELPAEPPEEVSKARSADPDRSPG